MAKITSLIILLSTFSCFISLVAAAEKSNLHISTTSDGSAAVEESNPHAAGKQEDWFHWGRPLPLVHPPIPAAGGFQWPHWEYVSPPRSAGGFQWPPQNWPHWNFVNPPMPATGGFTWPPNRPWPHWQFVQPPIPADSQWPSKDWPHWHFVNPPMPSGAKTTAAAPAA